MLTLQTYPPIRKGASLLIAYQLNDRPVLLIGGGNVAAGRLFFLLESGAKVTLVAPLPLDPSIAYRIRTQPEGSGVITHVARDYLGREDPIGVQGFAMVMTAIDNNPLSREVCLMARERGIPVNVADVPPECDFYFGAQFRRGPLQVMVSTQGQGPKIGALVRDRLLAALPENVEDAIAGVGQLRADLRKRAPGVGGPLGKKRMDWMIGICDKWSLGEMTVLKDPAVRAQVLDKGWDKDQKIVGPGDVAGGRGDLPGRIRRGWASWWGGDVAGAAVRGVIGGIAIGAVGMMAYQKYSPSR